ncbi:putative papain-like cysteine peptidase superfamily [Helianthus anomalus]
MELHSAKKRIQRFKKLICATSGLHYFHKKYTCTVGHYFEEVWDQRDTPYCMCYAAAQMVTILYRMHRPEEWKSLILSPQTLLNLGCQYVDRLRVFLTESEYGLYDIEAQPFHYLREKTRIVSQVRQTILDQRFGDISYKGNNPQKPL